MIESHFDHLERMLYLDTQLRLGVFDLSLYPKQHAVFAVQVIESSNRRAPHLLRGTSNLESKQKRKQISRPTGRAIYVYLGKLF
jgi:hypothetical protein